MGVSLKVLTSYSWHPEGDEACYPPLAVSPHRYSINCVYIIKAEKRVYVTLLGKIGVI